MSSPLHRIKNTPLRRLTLLAWIPVAAVAAVGVVLYRAAKEYAEAWHGFPGDFSAVWNGRQ